VSGTFSRACPERNPAAVFPGTKGKRGTKRYLTPFQKYAPANAYRDQIMGVDCCIFCGVSLDPSQKDLPSSRTEEHAFARWYRDVVVNKKIKMFTAVKGEPPVLHRQPPLDRLLNQNVCKRCNNGWMSQLETEVAPIVQRLTSGEDIRTFSDPETETLARWAAKTATVISHVTPQLQRVPRQASMSIHPDRRLAPKSRVFYCEIRADLTLEGGFVQLVYGSELGLVGTKELAGTRITLCVYNQCLTVDFPPIVEGISYDLSESCSAMLWPTWIPAGTPKINVPAPASSSDVLFAVCSRIVPRLDLTALSP